MLLYLIAGFSSVSNGTLHSVRNELPESRKEVKRISTFREFDTQDDNELEAACCFERSFKVTVNVFWVKISTFRFPHVLLAELSRHTMIHCLKLTEVLKMEEISCKRRFPEFLIKGFVCGLQNPYLNA